MAAFILWFTYIFSVYSKGLQEGQAPHLPKSTSELDMDEDVYENRHCQQKQGVCRNVKLNLNRFCLSNYMLIVGIVGSKPNDKWGNV